MSPTCVVLRGPRPERQGRRRASSGRHDVSGVGSMSVIDLCFFVLGCFPRFVVLVFDVFGECFGQQFV